MELLKDNIVLEDERVLLRLITLNDYEHLLPFALNEPDLWFFSLTTAAGEEGMKKYVADAVRARQDGHSFPFIVFDKKTNTYAGSTRYYDIQPANQSLQLGFTWYGKDFQGTGLNRHCKFLLLQYAFETLGIERVEFRANAKNERSVAAMKAIGCTVEGILRSHLPDHTSGRRDSIVLSILKEEWFNGVKADLEGKISDESR